LSKSDAITAISPRAAGRLYPIDDTHYLLLENEVSRDFTQHRCH
jgi:hypothetical protein